MTGIIDVGGGLRDVYSAGIYDYLLDEKINFEYCLGVSAGSANLITYVAGQKKRNLKFYMDYAFRKEYMSFRNIVKRGSYFDFDYIYSVLCNHDGENPIDYETFKNNKSDFVVVATNASDGTPHYFSKNDIQQDNYDILKASCSIPVVCKPYKVKDKYYFDGGVSDPMPYKKAFADGCDKLVVVLTRPLDYVKMPQKAMRIVNNKLKKYPQVANLIAQRHNKYNNGVKELLQLQQQGRVKIIAPNDCFGVSTLTRSKEAFQKLYDEGYKDAVEIKNYINEDKEKPSVI